MARKELRHNRHTVSLLTDHTVITPKYRGKILVEKMIALAVAGIVRTTCKEMKIEIIDKALECGSCSFVYRIPSKVLLSGFIAQRIKGRIGRELHKTFPHPTEWCEYRSLDTILFSWLGRSWMGGCGGYIQNQERLNAKYAVAQAPFLSQGFGDLKSIAYE